MNIDYCYKCMDRLVDGHCPACGAVEVEANPHCLKPGTVLREKYLIGLPIGAGGFGITYIGRDLVLDVRIAVKEYYPSQFSVRNSEMTPEVTVTSEATATAGRNMYEKSKERFLDEARILARFEHDAGIVNVKDFFEANNTAYIVMEYVDGHTLKEYLEQHGNFSAEEIITKMRPVMESLARLHEKGLVHRDISPDNIKMPTQGNLKLLDFGAARFIAADLDKTVTSMTKAGYAAEEQYRSGGEQGAWTDVYALNATIYKCLTGVTPPDSPQRLHNKTRNKQDLKAPSELGVTISPRWEAVIKRGMAVLQEDRYQSMDELLDAFDEKQETPEPIEGFEGGAVKEGAKWKNQRRRFTPAFVIAGIALIGLLIILVWNGKSNSWAEKEDTITFVLTKSEYMSAADYAKSVVIITERVQAMTDKSIIESTENNIKVTMEKSILGENDVMIYKTIRFLCGEGSFFITDNSADGLTVGIDKSEIISAEVKSGEIDFFIPGDDDEQLDRLRTADKSNMYYINVKTNNSGASKIKEVLKAGNEDIGIWANYFKTAAGVTAYTTVDVGLYSPVPGTDNEFNIIVYDCNQASLNSLVATVLTQYPLPGKFFFTILDDITWEKAAGVTKGAFQKDDITGDTVTLVYYYDDFTEEDSSQVVERLKKRMDAIGNPYVFGYCGTDQENNRKVAIKTTPEKLGEDFPSLIGNSGYMEIHTDNGTAFRNSYVDEIELGINQAPLGGGQIEISFKSDNIYGFEESVKDILNKTIYLSINGVTVSETNVTELNPDEAIIFSGLSFVNQPEITEDYRYILDLLNEIANGGRLIRTEVSQTNYGEEVSRTPTDLSLSFIYWEGSGEHEWGVATGTSDEFRVRKIMSENFSNVAISRNGRTPGYGFDIKLDLEANEELPERFMGLMESIYKTCGFDDGAFETIRFLNENTAKPDDQFSLTFSKISAHSWQDEEEVENAGKMAYRFYVSGQTFGKYKDEMEELVNFMEFFKDRPQYTPFY